jgi:hypothetical protein
MGEKFHRLEILSISKGRADCVCDCGTRKTIRFQDIRQGKIKSCGCLFKELASARLTAQNTKHGLSNSRVYHIWDSMIARCYRANSAGYKNYGGRGIKVCKRWHEFKNFYADMGEPNGLTLDRINTNKNYSKSNCRWASYEEQANNRTNNIVLEFRGKRKTLCEWARELGVSTRKLYNRYYANWTIERTLTTP